MFDKFAQGALRSEGATGCGLGLAIVAGLAAAQGGAVWYEPNSPSGACFGVRLPAPRDGSDLVAVHESEGTGAP